MRALSPSSHSQIRSVLSKADARVLRPREDANDTNEGSGNGEVGQVLRSHPGNPRTTGQHQDRRGDLNLPLHSQDLEEKLTAAGKTFVRVLLSEIFPEKLAMFKEIDW